MQRRSTASPENRDRETKAPSALILSKFNTVYRHSVLDILTHYTEIPTDPNPDNHPLTFRDPNDSLNNSNTRDADSNSENASPSLTNSKNATDNAISNVKFKSIDLNEVVISFKHPLFDLEMLRPIQYPHKCTTWDQVKAELIEMSKTAATARHLSHLRVSGISYPVSMFNLLLIFMVGLLPFGYYYPELLYDGFFSKYLPFMMAMQPYHNTIFFATIVCHLLEIYFLMLPRFTKFRVPMDYAIEWTILALLDGFSSIKRFDQYVVTLSPDDVYYDFTNTETLM
jgi:hypothetical protein